jgi:PEP-CTERM motif
MASQRPKVRSLRRLSASSRARREKRAAAKRRLTYLGSAAGVAIVLAAPLSIAAFMNMGSSVPGMEAAKSFLAMMTDRSPGDRTKAELTKTKQAKLPDVPEQRALGKIAKPEPPKEFLEAIAPTVAKPVEEFAPALAALGPLLVTPPPGGGGGIIIPPQSPPGGGGGTPPGGGTTPPENPPPENPPPENPPPENPPPENPPPEQPPVVPEPGTWATMLLGFGFTGLVMRRRRRKSASPLFG